mmetsp:Transcript_11000/g.18440  ORF Transcript_11000/g.18440 Transcript_11000/m.18440 type:complete len:125 (-) Transcript_11000:36-410(-)
MIVLVLRLELDVTLLGPHIVVMIGLNDVTGKGVLMPDVHGEESRDMFEAWLAGVPTSLAVWRRNSTDAAVEEPKSELALVPELMELLLLCLLRTGKANSDRSGMQPDLKFHLLPPPMASPIDSS